MSVIRHTGITMHRHFHPPSEGIQEVNAHTVIIAGKYAYSVPQVQPVLFCFVMFFTAIFPRNFTSFTRGFNIQIDNESAPTKGKELDPAAPESE